MILTQQKPNQTTKSAGWGQIVHRVPALRSSTDDYDGGDNLGNAGKAMKNIIGKKTQKDLQPGSRSGQKGVIPGLTSKIERSSKDATRTNRVRKAHTDKREKKRHVSTGL